jgi:hypothetical protein
MRFTRFHCFATTSLCFIFLRRTAHRQRGGEASRQYVAASGRLGWQHVADVAHFTFLVCPRGSRLVEQHDVVEEYFPCTTYHVRISWTVVRKVW